MTQQDRINYWKISAQRDKNTSDWLFKGKKYDQSLFYCHLYLEKILKGIYEKTSNKIPPYTHRLTKLVELSNLQLTSEQLDQLDEITTFNIKTRYEDYKQEFYKKATKKFSQKYRKISESLYLCLLQHL